MTVGVVPTRSDVSACLFEHACWIGSSYVSNVSAESFLIIGWTDVSVEPFLIISWTDVSAVPFLIIGWTDISARAFLTLVVRCKCRAFWHGGLVPRMAKCKCWAIPIIGWMDVSAGPFWQGCGLCYHMVRCECWALPFWYEYRISSYMFRCKCWVGHSDLSVIYKRWGRPTWWLGLHPTWKRDGSVELPVKRRIMR